MSRYLLETPVLESLFNKVTDLKACSFIKKMLQHKRFPVNIAKYLKTPTIRIICKRPLLSSQKTSLKIEDISRFTSTDHLGFQW